MNSPRGIIPQQEKKQIRLAKLFRLKNLLLVSFRNFFVYQKYVLTACGIIPFIKIACSRRVELFYLSKLITDDEWNYSVWRKYASSPLGILHMSGTGVRRCTEFSALAEKSHTLNKKHSSPCEKITPIACRNE